MVVVPSTVRSPVTLASPLIWTSWPLSAYIWMFVVWPPPAAEPMLIVRLPVVPMLIA